MRFWLAGPRIMGIRPGISFSPTDFGNAGVGNRVRTMPNDGRPAGSFVYVATGHNMVKIGVTSNPSARLANLQTGNAFPLNFAFLCVARDNGYTIEAKAHELLAQYRLEGEWFDVAPELAIAAVTGAAAQLGQPVCAVSRDQADEVVRQINLVPISTVSFEPFSMAVLFKRIVQMLAISLTFIFAIFAFSVLIVIFKVH